MVGGFLLLHFWQDEKNFPHANISEWESTNKQVYSVSEIDKPIFRVQDAAYFSCFH